MRRSTRRWRWSTPGSMPIARRRRRSALFHFDVLPEAESAADRLHFRARRLVGPRGTRVPLAGHDDVVELHAMRTGPVVRSFFGLFQPVHAHRGRREILIALAIDDIV